MVRINVMPQPRHEILRKVNTFFLNSKKISGIINGIISGTSRDRQGPYGLSRTFLALPSGCLMIFTPLAGED